MAKRNLDENGFNLNPTHLDENHWFYADKTGLCVAYIAKGTLQSIVGFVEIPWSRLKPAIEAQQKLARKRARAKAARR